MSTKEQIEEQAIPQRPYHRFLTLRKRLVRNVVLNAISIGFALAGMVWAGSFFWHYHAYEITNDAVVDQYITPINIRVGGYIKEVRFIEHQQVKAGDTLLILDNREYRIKWIEAEAALQETIATEEALQSGIYTSENNISVSESNIAETKARLWKAEQDYKRYANLLKEESVSQQQYEQAEAEYHAVKARYESLIKQKESTRSQSSELKKKIKSAQAQILRKKADLELAQLNLSYTVVLAPFEGHMGRRTLEEGQLVQAGQTISNLVRGNDKWITANYKETQIANIYIGQPVDVRVDAFRSKSFHGKVVAISEATGSKYSLIPTDNSAGNFVKIQQRIPVRIELEDVTPEEMSRLRAGMMVETEAKIKN